MVDSRYQRSRYELKYLIDEPCARQVRDFVRSYLVRDGHARAGMGFAYPIYSIYLDDAGFGLYRATVQAQKNRFKLRIRYYDDRDADGPLFFEIKRRVNDIIMKERAVVRRGELAALLHGACTLRDACVDPGDAESHGVLGEFFRLRDAINASPNIIVYFQREAWVSPTGKKLDGNVRVTFDRRAAVAPFAGTLSPPHWTDARVPEVILELKFDDRFPRWMHELVTCCDLHRSSMGKYAHCMGQVRHVRLAASSMAATAYACGSA